MKRVRARGEDIRRFIIEHVEKHPADISKLVAKHFDITRQAVNKHLKNLVLAEALVQDGQTRNQIYKLAPLFEWTQTYKIVPTLAEDLVWRKDIQSLLGNLPDNVLNIWHYGFTEMFNNAIDHSAGSEIVITVRKTATSTEVIIQDNGLGIFKKIQTALDLLDERHALLELAKGKLTTDPKRHSGEGIFFASRMFDAYLILSDEISFYHKFEEPEDWLLETKKFAGTMVYMKLYNHTSRTAKKIFDQYTSGEDYGFNKTVVPVSLAQYGNDQLISRSQAKRLLLRVELFKVVIFDFKDVEFIGQAFADEIFRVFALQHPEIELQVIHANIHVNQMITRARLGLTP
jgi:hypothetical protein